MRYPITASERVIILPVKLRGEVTARGFFVLDTGASYTMIPWRIAVSLGLPPKADAERLAITTASGAEMVPLVTVPAVSVMGFRAENVIAAVHDLPPQANVDGLLGLSFLKYFRLIVDFKEGYLELG